MSAVLPLVVWSDKLVLLVHWVLVNRHVFVGFIFFPFPLATDVDADNYDEKQDNAENPSTNSKRKRSILKEICKIQLVL